MPSPPLPARVTAGIVWPVTSPPIAGGAVLVGDDGRVAAVGGDDEVPRPAEAASVEYPDAVVLPGLINAHTHLELHPFRGQVPEADFVAWLLHMRRIRKTTGEETYLEGARAGVLEAWRYGTTTVADTGVGGAAIQALAELGGRGIYYQEVIEPNPARCGEALANLVQMVGSLRRDAPPTVAIGISPHAPYTVSPELFSRAADYARTEGLPLASHVAESPVESKFVTRGAGAFAWTWRIRRIPLPPRARSPIAYLERLGLLGEGFLAIHAVQVDKDDIACLARTHTAVAICPRSNRRHGHGSPPLASLLEAGVQVGLGTDSVASVDTLDLFAEARAAKELAGLAPETAMRLVTVDAARAIGMDHAVGSLAPGMWADLCVVRADLRSGLGEAEVAGMLVGAEASDILATYVAGRRVYIAGRS